MIENDTAEDEIEKMVEQIRAFTEDISDPDSWMICIPLDSFDKVDRMLDTDKEGVGTRYNGVSLAYSTDHEEVWVEYTSPISEYADQHN